MASKKKKTVKRKTGRPKGSTEPVPPKHIAGICEWVSDGNTLEDYCKQPNTPHPRSVSDWLRKDDAFFSAYTRARAVGGDAIASNMLEIADEGDEKDVQHRRLKLDTRKWLLARWFPTNYGDRMKHEHDGNVSLTVVSGVPQVEDGE